ncbi:FtsJ-like methyltransferase-domain-containing protein [Bisporella sp. PMI_857]|nr:FtsJ-like methyltransferase-domain-containing protein [Bisporella sp. PMI_857]
MLSQNAAQAFFTFLSINSRSQPSLFCRKVVSGSLKLYPSAIRHTRPSSSSTRWKSRQGRDAFAREAKVQGLKSRAAFKLLEIDAKYKIFKKGQTVVDLGYAPGSWSRVAVERTKPNGRIVGIDIIPAQPPKGVSTIQGNFLSPSVRDSVKEFLRDNPQNRTRPSIFTTEAAPGVLQTDRNYIDLEQHVAGEGGEEGVGVRMRGRSGRKEVPGRVVDVVLSDMSAPWDQTSGFWKRSLSDPYYRMMNTSGINFKDHAGSMDLCTAALLFAHDTLRVGGHFVCKFYQGAEDRELEGRLRKMFAAVYREKPESSRSESKEAYFVAMRRKSDPPKKPDHEEDPLAHETSATKNDYCGDNKDGVDGVGGK